MKRKFYFQRENAPLKLTSVIYVVWVGKSDRELNLLSRVCNYAKAHGSTFRKWDESIDFYLDHEADRLFAGSSLLHFGFVRASVSLEVMVKLCESGCWEAYENSLAQPKSSLHVLGILNPYEFSKKSPRRKHKTCPESQRKNLSEMQPLIAFV